jgi:ElaB/YqjD/DUF883 family membrane-anchored ribosome-binding protein
MNTPEMSDTAEQLKEQARDYAEQAKETARLWRERAKEKARDAGIAADRYVHENVWTTVAFAAITGCVVGYLLGRSKD